MVGKEAIEKATVHGFGTFEISKTVLSVIPQYTKDRSTETLIPQSAA
jgi:hypothetical protein